MFLTDEDIEAIQDESVAHGMTLSANLIRHELETTSCKVGVCDSCTGKSNSMHSILTARDNKVWRKG